MLVYRNEMLSPSPSKILFVAAFIGIGIAIFDYCDKDFNGQVVATVFGLIGAAWFAARRMDALEKTSENQPIKDAVQLISNEGTTSQLAGVRLLHLIAKSNSASRELVRELICAHLTGGGHQDKAATLESKALALRMLFAAPHREIYRQCDSPAILDGAILDELPLEGLEFGAAMLRRATFMGKGVYKVKFRNTNLSEAKWGSKVVRADMRDAILVGTHASSCDFRRVCFNNAKICSEDGRETKFNACRFIDCDFTGANLDGAHFPQCLFRSCKGLKYEQLKGARVQTATGIPEEIVQKLKSHQQGGYGINGHD